MTALPSRIVKPRREQRIRCPGHLKWLRGFECVVPGCHKRPIEAAHVRNGSIAGMGLKPDDTEAVSMCRDHHAESHRIGHTSFEAKYKLNLKDLAGEFSRQSPHRAKWSKPR